MNPPGWGVGSGSPTGSRHSVAESRFSVTRLRTRYGTGVIAEDGEGPVGASALGRFFDLLFALALMGEPRQRVHFLCDINPCGAPRNTAPAAHAARAAELVMPGAQLVGQPVPVPRRPRLPDASLVHEREVELVTRRPVHPTLGVLAGEVGDVLDAGAEAGGAHHGAISTGQTPAGDLLPVRRLPRFHQQLTEVTAGHMPAHPVRGLADIASRRVDF